MSRGMRLIEKRDLADRLLAFLARQPQRSWPSTNGIMTEAVAHLDCEMFDLWKAYDLLRVLGRIELNKANGRRGFRILDITPLTMPWIQVLPAMNADNVIYQLCKSLYSKYPTEFRSAAKELLRGEP